MVAECIVYCRRLIEKLVGSINSIYVGMSNRCNVRIITALYLRFALLYNITKCNTVFNFNKKL